MSLVLEGMYKIEWYQIEMKKRVDSQKKEKRHANASKRLFLVCAKHVEVGCHRVKGISKFALHGIDGRQLQAVRGANRYQRVHVTIFVSDKRWTILKDCGNRRWYIRSNQTNVSFINTRIRSWLTLLQSFWKELVTTLLSCNRAKFSSSHRFLLKNKSFTAGF